MLAVVHHLCRRGASSQQLCAGTTGTTRMLSGSSTNEAEPSIVEKARAAVGECVS